MTSTASTHGSSLYMHPTPSLTATSRHSYKQATPFPTPADLHPPHPPALQEAARRKQEALDRKKANQAKSAVVTAVSTATAKKLMKHKKQRKLLKTADTN